MSDFNTDQQNVFTHLDAETKEKLDDYNRKKARNMSIAVFLYIFSVAFLIFMAALFNAERSAIIGVTGMFTMIAAATGIIVYTNTLVPYDLIPYVKGNKIPEFEQPNYKNPKKTASFFKLYWMIVTIIYLGFSFSTGRWGITWLIWLIGVAVKEAITLFTGAEEDEE